MTHATFASSWMVDLVFVPLRRLSRSRFAVRRSVAVRRWSPLAVRERLENEAWPCDLFGTLGTTTGGSSTAPIRSSVGSERTTWLSDERNMPGKGFLMPSMARRLERATTENNPGVDC
jgi:hypothetical protein